MCYQGQTTTFQVRLEIMEQAANGLNEYANCNSFRLLLMDSTPATLLVALQTDPSWRDQPLPSRAQIARLLKQAGLTRRYNRITICSNHLK